MASREPALIDESRRLFFKNFVTLAAVAKKLVTPKRGRPSNTLMSLASSLEGLAPDAIDRACSGEKVAVEELVRVMQRPFYNLALRMLADRSAAEDAAQECLLRVITHLSQYRHESKFATWATRIAVNAIFDFKSGIARHARYGADDFTHHLAAGRDDTADETSEDALVLKQAKTLCSRALLQALDGEQRVAFVLGEILEFEAEDAAAILAIQPANFRKRLSRARAEVTAVLGRECSLHTAGRACACHRQVGAALRTGQLDPEALEVRIGDLTDLRTRLTVLDNEPRTRAMYQNDETPDLREAVMVSLRAALFQIAM